MSGFLKRIIFILPFFSLSIYRTLGNSVGCLCGSGQQRALFKKQKIYINWLLVTPKFYQVRDVPVLLLYSDTEWHVVLHTLDDTVFLTTYFLCCKENVKGSLGCQKVRVSISHIAFFPNPTLLTPCASFGKSGSNQI